jgi:GxxExxY protein
MLTTIPTTLDTAFQPVDRGPAVVLDRLANSILGAFFAVYRELGYGFLPSVYLKALALELSTRCLRFEHQVPFSVFYQGRKVGHYRADLAVEARAIVEIRVGPVVTPVDESQVLNSLRCSQAEVALLLHFGPVADFRRFDAPLAKRLPDTAEGH